MILSIKTDSPTAEVGLWDEAKNIELHCWNAGRQLSEQLLNEVESLLKRHQLRFGNLTGVIVFRGPGSFTGLRIGITVANTIAYSQTLPIMGGMGEDWARNSIKALGNKQDDIQVMPEYGAPVNITRPKR